jgi:hypothetical protein
MHDPERRLRQSAQVMRLVGWALSVGLVALILIYPPGFMWGAHPEAFPHIGPAHPPSPYHGLHPYLFMLGALYLAYGILMIRGARDPKANAALFDFGILSSVLHGLVMVPQAFHYPNEHAHFWADIPALAVIAAVCWIWHPNRAARGFDDASRTRPG